MVKNIRMLSQELVTPQFNKSKDLVAWMGAVQAQDIVMSKWAVGVRLKTPSLADIEQALAAGEIVRTHVLRPTWHMVAAEDIRWMLALTGKRIKAACASWGKSYGVDEQLYPKCCKQLEKLLANGQHLTKTEIGERLMQEKAIENEVQMSCLLSLAEAEGLVCNGVERNKKHTYALLDERVPLCKELTKEEALATLARK
ncbi:winged helix DNA-binding domain-containing protein, partial [Parabacteroides sp. OttesenSCG-928-G21]|nr:winged helix DNA-binding domain-containing protein [Parabacteroides sp. OttesenSCG-928-G21]